MLAAFPVRSELQDSSPHEIVRWAVTTFGRGVAMSSSFQMQSLPLLHIVSLAAPELPIIFLDTGYHFPETLAFRDRLVSEWKLNLRVVRARMARSEFVHLHGPDLYRRDPDLCCYINKVEPMQLAMRGMKAWISGIRRDQTLDRADAAVVEESQDGLTRVHPMARWSAIDIAQYIHDHQLPEHPLLARGYLSVGCAPCTRPAVAGDERSGRWTDSDRTECGLHTRLRSDRGDS